MVGIDMSEFFTLEHPQSKNKVALLFKNPEHFNSAMKTNPSMNSELGHNLINRQFLHQCYCYC